MNHKQPMASLQVSTSADDDSEERLRLSLSRLGSTKHRPSRPHQLAQPVRRRFVKDGEVPTEYAGRGHDLPSAPSAADDAVSGLRTELAAEQAARAEAELALTAAKAAAKTLQTRVAHMELELEEVRARAARAAEAAEAAEAARLLEARPAARAVRMPKPAAAALDDDDDALDGPQPVKWWLKK